MPRRSSGSSRADRAVEPTRSQNITVSWRRSASSRGFGSDAGADFIWVVLLDHKLRRWFGGMLRMQHWHRGRVGAMATANRRWMVAIEFGTWRCGRIGGAAGSVTAGNGRFFDCSGAIRS